MDLAFRDEVPPVPKTNRPNLNFSPKMLLIAGGAVLAIIIALIILSFSSGGGVSKKLQHLSARLTTLQTMVEDSKKSVADPKLSKLSSDLGIITSGSIAKLQAPLKTAGADKIGDDVKKAEADAATMQTLEEAKLTGIFDRTYARIMEQKIDTIMALLNEIYPDAKGATLRSTLTSIYNDFKTIRQQFDEDINV